VRKFCGLSLYSLYPEDSESAVPIGLMHTATFLFLVAMDSELPQSVQCIGPYWCLDLQRFSRFSTTSDVHVGEKNLSPMCAATALCHPLWSSNRSPLHWCCLSVLTVASSHGAFESISLHRILLLHHQEQQEVFSSWPFRARCHNALATPVISVSEETANMSAGRPRGSSSGSCLNLLSCGRWEMETHFQKAVWRRMIGGLRRAPETRRSTPLWRASNAIVTHLVSASTSTSSVRHKRVWHQL
jgi:hypothetical protein